MSPIQRYRATLAGQATDRLPCQVITMRFASRLIRRPYHDYVMDHRVLAEAQMAVCQAFGVDCLQTISDPCREVHDLGGRCHYFEDEAPANDAVHPLLADKRTLADLRPPDLHAGGRMADRVRAVALLRERSGPDVSVQGWIEGPIALAVDLRGMANLMIDTVDDPAFVQNLFDFCIATEIAFAQAQVEAGADTIGIGDAAASLVSPRTYDRLVFEPERRLVQAVHDQGALVRLHVCGNTTHLVDRFDQLGCDLIDIDHLCDLRHARANIPHTALLGNMDPTVYLLQGTPEQVHEKLAKCHRTVGPGFVVGAGCEVPPDTPHRNFEALVDYAHHHAGVAAVDARR